MRTPKNKRTSSVRIVLNDEGASQANGNGDDITTTRDMAETPSRHRLVSVGLLLVLVALVGSVGFLAFQDDPSDCSDDGLTRSTPTCPTAEASTDAPTAEAARSVELDPVVEVLAADDAGFWFREIVQAELGYVALSETSVTGNPVLQRSLDALTWVPIEVLFEGDAGFSSIFQSSFANLIATDTGFAMLETRYGPDRFSNTRELHRWVSPDAIRWSVDQNFPEIPIDRSQFVISHDQDRTVIATALDEAFEQSLGAFEQSQQGQLLIQHVKPEVIAALDGPLCGFEYDDRRALAGFPCRTPGFNVIGVEDLIDPTLSDELFSCVERLADRFSVDLDVVSADGVSSFGDVVWDANPVLLDNGDVLSLDLATSHLGAAGCDTFFEVAADTTALSNTDGSVHRRPTSVTQGVDGVLAGIVNDAADNAFLATQSAVFRYEPTDASWRTVTEFGSQLGPGTNRLVHLFDESAEIVVFQGDQVAWGSPGETLRTLRIDQEIDWVRPLSIDERRLIFESEVGRLSVCLLYTSPSPRDRTRSRMPSSA